MSVWADAEEDEVKDWEPSGVFLGELMDKRLLIRVGELFEVIQEGYVDGVNVLFWYGNLAKEFLPAKIVVGVFVIQRYTALISEEDLPVGRIR